jgi:hypothetical protein
MYKVPSPFNSPFTKSIFAVFAIAWVGMLLALIFSDDRGFAFIFVGWTLFLPWIAWAFLSGVQVRPNVSVGGGPMYATVKLEPGEQLAFNAPSQVDGIAGHLFVTDQRVISLPLRSLGAPRSIPNDRLTSVTVEPKRNKWDKPSGSMRFAHEGRETLVKPIQGSSGDEWGWFMGIVPASDFVTGIVSALRQAGIRIEEEASTSDA